MNISRLFDRRSLVKAGAFLGAVSTAFARAARVEAEEQSGSVASEATSAETTMAEIPLSATAKVTVERRGQVVLIGINRPYIHNRIDPETYSGLATAYYQFDHDPSLRAAVLFGHGDNFSRGIDVDAFAALVTSGRSRIEERGMIDPLAKAPPVLSKPLVVVVHGDTWNMGHELHLAADIRIAAADTVFGQDENTHGRFPGGGSTIRFVREAGWGNAMRYMLTGDHWGTEEAFRMGVVQELAPTREKAFEAGVAIATKIAACGPLGIRTTLASAHLAVDPSEAEALSKLNAQYGALYKTEDFKEGRRAEAEGRQPAYHGK
ncbi:enoyl-CoA hydratase-related protein [Bradyrhizobium sp.]|uniref:enoyl-CoA hydratase-related protein n=1 Tax=Bradyrhizobium sp. TaxID=376 RepID=UPI002C9CF34E|nr:enoyl-CoA hydratase-related protein [Bradyrhizobium sp.]HWX60883.1 enoyl-CoA hydratase-related protein [Bradyrhizobium sp.]